MLRYLLSIFLNCVKNRTLACMHARAVVGTVPARRSSCLSITADRNSIQTERLITCCWTCHGPIKEDGFLDGKERGIARFDYTFRKHRPCCLAPLRTTTFQYSEQRPPRPTWPVSLQNLRVQRKENSSLPCSFCYYGRNRYRACIFFI